MRLNARTIGYITICFALVFLTVSAFYVYLTFYRGWTDRTITAVDIGNLKPDNPIKVGGVVIGRIREMTRDPVNNLAVMRVRMRSDVPIHADYKILNMDVGLMGDRSLFLMPGYSEELVPEDAALNAVFISGIAEGISNADTLGVVIADLKKLVAEYARVDRDDGSLFTTQFIQVLRSMDKATLKLDAMVSGKEPVVTRTAGKIGRLADGLSRDVRGMRAGVEGGLKKAEEISLRTGVLLDSLAPLVDELAVLVDDLESGKNPVGRIATDKKMYGRLILTLKAVRQVVNTIKSDGVALDVDLF